VRGLIVGGIGGGTAEAAYANAAVQIRRGRIKSTAELLEALTQIVPSDEAFRANFETATVYRIKTGLYLLLAIENAVAETAPPALPSSEDRQRYVAQMILPHAYEGAGWKGWSADQVSSLSRRLGNFALLPAGARMTGSSWEERQRLLRDSNLKTNVGVSELEQWEPQSVIERQRAFAVVAPEIWPLIP
jgi:hypothetical protein